MKRSRAIAAGLAAGAAALALLATASGGAAQPLDADPLLSARMRELKRLRAELARLQAEIPRASNARKLAIEHELGTLDAKLERLLQQQSPLEDAPIGGWVPLIGPSIDPQAGRTYAGVVQLGWMLSLVVSRSTLESKLREALQWSALQVAQAPIPGQLIPWTVERSSGRYWVLGTLKADSKTLPRPEQLLELFVRA